MIAPKSLTPHSDLLNAERRGVQSRTYRVTAAQLDGRGDPLLLFSTVERGPLLRYADHHGYRIEWSEPWRGGY